VLLQYLGDLGCDHVVLKNDEKTVDEVWEMHPRGILVSPGPGNSPECSPNVPSADERRIGLMRSRCDGPE
jgi:anthranilate synthase component 2